MPEEVQQAVKHWSQWIDYWAVDWDNKGDTFHNEWQTYRTRKDTTLAAGDDAHLRRAGRVHGRGQGDRHPRQRHDQDAEGEGRVAMPRKQARATAEQLGLLEARVDDRALRARASARRSTSGATADYKGVTDTTRTLLNYWFHTDHRLPNGRPFAYHYSQREAIETLIYLYEVARSAATKTCSRRYADATPICACCSTTTSPATASRWRPAAARPR